jgi:hypothetical protein
MKKGAETNSRTWGQSDIKQGFTTEDEKYSIFLIFGAYFQSRPAILILLADKLLNRDGSRIVATKMTGN